jgi:hypothetical protein
MTALAASHSAIRNLVRYLHFIGWTPVDHPNTRVQIFQAPEDELGGRASVTVPASPDLRDAGGIINEAASIIAEYTKAPLGRICDSVLRWDRDILRTRFFSVLGSEDTLPLGIAADAVAELKELIGYSAYTHTNPQPYFDKAGGISGEFTKHCLFGHTFHGSFGLTIECPFEVTQNLELEGVDPIIPFNRQVFERLANGLITLRQAVSSESIDPLLQGYQTGFSANMCRTLAELYEKADGRRVEYDFSWSPQLHTRYERDWKPVVFEGRAYEIARVAATELERSEKHPDSIVEGRVVILRSDMPPGLDEQAEFEHIVTMNWEREKTQNVRIRVPLSPTEYIAACDAHKTGRAIRIFGVPVKSGKFWTLTKTHDFVVL